MADILIRMEMPKHCFNCSTKVDPDNRRCNIDGHVFEETLSKLTCRRDEHCPLHELPEHGNLIDRDAVFDGEADIISSDGYYAESGFSRDMLRCMPVIVPSNKEAAE